MTVAERSGAFPTRNQLATELHIPFYKVAGGGFLCQMWQKNNVISSRLRDFLCRQICQRKLAGPQLELLGALGWL
jgi:hypothetical protein